MPRWIHSRLRALTLAILGTLPFLDPDGVEATPAMRTARIIVPVAAGSSLDTLARAVAKPVADALGRPMVVENHPGAGGNIAYALAASAAPDGNTILAGWDSLSINTALYSNVPYKLSQFAPLTLAVRVPQVLVIHPRLRIDTAEDLVRMARARPAGINVGSPGSGTPGHLAGTLLEAAAGIALTHVPYRGGAPAVSDLLAGHLEVAIVSVPTALPHVRTGRLKALAVTTARRATVLPDTPTLGESGFKRYDLHAWQGFFVPAETPRGVVNRLQMELIYALRQPELRAALEAQGFDVVAEPSEALARELRVGTPRWAALVRASGARVD